MKTEKTLWAGYAGGYRCMLVLVKDPEDEVFLASPDSLELQYSIEVRCPDLPEWSRHYQRVRSAAMEQYLLQEGMDYL